MSENDKDYMRMIRWLLLWLSLLWVSPLIDHDYTTLVVVFALLKRPERPVWYWNTHPGFVKVRLKCKNLTR